MILISFLLAVSGFLTGLSGRRRWSVMVTSGMIACLVPFAAWSILMLAGGLITAAAPLLPKAFPHRPDITVLVLSSAPLAALWAGGWIRDRRSQLRLHRITTMDPRGFVEEIDRLANHPGLAGHDWLETRWSRWTQQQKRAWVSRRMTSLRALHRESAGLGFSRLGRRAADRLSVFDTPPEQE
ncbi:hypothetical protein [Albimonas donghaensis]|uniref:hypothetical protein n=1 Tax=Albimonas donghaensis TaxID=356660 RepID=UPI00115F9D80|nr:hypothetical protein [Albimonas donghaensis]